MTIGVWNIPAKLDIAPGNRRERHINGGVKVENTGGINNNSTRMGNIQIISRDNTVFHAR